MKNPKAWAGATPYSRTSPTDLSSSGKSEGKGSNTRGHAHPTRTWKATPMKGVGPTPDSQAIDAIPASTSTHPALSVKESTVSPAYGPGAQLIGAPKTGEKTFSNDPKEDMPRKWYKRYSVDSGVAGSGKARKPPNK
jgi:hypothetical protein